MARDNLGFVMGALSKTMGNLFDPMMVECNSDLWGTSFFQGQWSPNKCHSV